MTAADTSFLCALYRNQDNTARAVSYRNRMDGPLTVTRLLLWEFRQSARFQAFRHKHNPAVGHPVQEAEKMISDLKEDLDCGVVIVSELDLLEILAIAERVSKARTCAGGHRSFDVLHVSAAHAMDADSFLSFDGNQNKLAAAEGLATPLADEA
jgi:predicted nucleic acid-binding protein